MEYTISIPTPLVIIIVIGVSVLFFAFILFAIIRAIAKGKKARLQLEREEKLSRLKGMMPDPWFEAYELCRAAGDYRTRSIWFAEWLRRQVSLPRLSFAAVKEFAIMVGQSSGDADYRLALEKLVHYCTDDILCIMNGCELGPSTVNHETKTITLVNHETKTITFSAGD